MIILEMQMAGLARQARDLFVATLVGELRGAYPETTSSMTDVDLAGVIREGMVSARSYGIELAGDVESYIHLSFELGFDFDRKVEWAREILNRPDFTGRIRIDLLCAVHEGRAPARGGLFLP
jgi:hypothetical protein